MTTASATVAPVPANRLGREKSPYLLQHQFNPVDWFAWGDEAFDRARQENKLIFLSIGYSTCHWCHVMERESFENQDTAAYLNQHFISIKVDREERPDVDRIYMAFVQATTGQGGWPLNIFLTPDLKPFFGGTYFPPEGGRGRPGFLHLLGQIRKLWDERGQEVLESAADLHQRLAQASATSPPAGEPDLSAETVRHAGLRLKEAFDPRHGGFGDAPKFPQPSQPQFLLRYAHRFEDAEAVRMVLHMCDRMAAGGIHDQLGGGFARYSVDAEWLVPHFEKMLYDNAQLAQLYLDAFLVSGEPRHARVARGILDYVLRDMTHPDGGFYSAEDADSEGHEGKFYCWTRGELSRLLTPEEFAVAVRYYGVTERGNFVDHSHPQPLAGQNVLSVVDPGLTEPETRVLESARARLLAERSKRVRPHLDDKILASWNGLMLGAFARAHAVLGEQRYLLAAEKNLAFLQQKLWDPGSRALWHRWRDAERDNVQLLEGCAFLLSGVLELYETGLQAKHLDFAVALADCLLSRFYDAEDGGFWQAPGSARDLILRLKQDHDGAEPSGSSVAALSLLKLGAITGTARFTEAARKTLRLFADRLQRLPQAVPFLLQALDFSLQEPHRVVIAGPTRSPETGALLQAAHSVYQPNKVVLGSEGAVEAWVRALPAQPGATVYVCTGTACQPPISAPEQLRETLRQAHPAA